MDAEGFDVLDDVGDCPDVVGGGGAGLAHCGTFLLGRPAAFERFGGALLFLRSVVAGQGAQDAAGGGHGVGWASLAGQVCDPFVRRAHDPALG